VVVPRPDVSVGQDGGVHEPPARRPTSADVARLSGVSRATVSYVLNDDPRQTISGATRRRVHEAVEALGYVPSAAASALRRGRSRLVLLALDPLFSGHISDLLVEGITERLRREGYVVVCHSHVLPETIVDIAREISAVAVVSLTFLTPAIRRSLQAAGVRRILAAAEVSEGLQGPPDRPWELPIGQLQVDHLASRGYDRLVYALPERSHRLPIAQARLLGVRMECATLGLDQPEVIALPLDRAVIARRLRELDRVPGRTALCAYEDQIGIGVLGAMAELGWRVRADLAVIGCDDLPVASLVTPSLTTVVLDAEQVGAAVAEAFLQLDDDEVRVGWVAGDLSYTVVERDST
jgi:DNA-binding LacI/PurR family transcriptional regulator